MTDEFSTDQLEAARQSIQRGRYAAAFTILNELAAGQPDPAVLLERGRLWQILGDLVQARRDFNAASILDPAGACGDAARAELLRSLISAPPKSAALHSAPAPRPRPHRWIEALVMSLLIFSILCSLLTILLTGRPAWMN